MAKTRFSSKRLSFSVSLRDVDFDFDDMSINSVDFFNNLRSRSRSRSRSTITSSIQFWVPPTPIDAKKGVSKSGYDLRFEIPEEDAEVKEMRSRSKSWFPQQVLNTSNYINLSAVAYSLNRKSYLTNSSSWQGERFLDLDQTVPSRFVSLKDKNKDLVVFGGKLRYLGQSEGLHVTRPVDNERLFSIFVQSPQSESQDSQLWSWPWLDMTQRAFDLYSQTELNCIKNQTENLPLLPCPLQAHSLLRYLQSVKPCVPEIQYEKTKSIVETLALKYGESFHENIYNHYVNNESWVVQTLPNCNFSKCTENAPLINMSIISPFCHDVWSEESNSVLLERSCQIIKFVREFWQICRSEKLKTISDDKGHSFNMTQFYSLFSSVRLPGVPSAAPFSYFKTNQEGETPRHIIVIHRGQLFTMNILDSNYEPLPLKAIEDSLKEILLYSSNNSGHPIGILTSADMETWATLRQCLIEVNENNQANLLEIEQAIFVLSIDHKKVNGFDMLVNEALFGDGYNRWYDKSLNFYIYHNGLVTVNVNRLLIDGPTVAHLLYFMHLRIMEDMDKWNNETTNTESSESVDTASKHRRLSNQEAVQQELLELQQRTLKSGRQRRLNSLESTEARLLQFDLDEFLESEIEEHSLRFKILSLDLITAVCKEDAFDNEFFSKHQINKDAFAHMVLQLTFYKMYFRVASVGCRISLKKFHGMHYDTLRPTTSEMAEWCRAMLNPETDDDYKEKLFWSAEKVHRKLLQECYNGQGFDNYINAMRALAEELPHLPRDMFDDESFVRAGSDESYEISTESLGVGCTSCPVVPPINSSGYGVGYSIASSFIFFTVTSWNSEASTNADLYAASIRLTLQDLFSICSRWYSKRNIKASV